MESPEPSRIISAPCCRPRAAGFQPEPTEGNERERRAATLNRNPLVPLGCLLSSPMPVAAIHEPSWPGMEKTMLSSNRTIRRTREIRGRCGEEDGQTGKRRPNCRKDRQKERRSNWQTCRQFGKRMGNRCCPNLNLVLNRDRCWKRIEITMKIMIRTLPAIRQVGGSLHGRTGTRGPDQGF